MRVVLRLWRLRFFKRGTSVSSVHTCFIILVSAGRMYENWFLESLTANTLTWADILTRYYIFCSLNFFFSWFKDLRGVTGRCMRWVQRLSQELLCWASQCCISWSVTTGRVIMIYLATRRIFTFVATYDVQPHGDLSVLVNGNFGWLFGFVYHT
jgi:hypothetical protein